ESNSRAEPGARTQPELWTPGLGAGCFPGRGLSFQHESKSTNTVLIWCRSAIPRYLSMRSLNPEASCSHGMLCKNTRTLFMPMLWAKPSSRSIVAGSNVSACHISSWLIAVLGMKLQPTIHGCCSYQRLAFSADQRGAAAADEATSIRTATRLFIFTEPVLANSRVFR